MPSGDRTRPTTDRVREALFSALAAWAGTSAAAPEATLDGLSFCDLYAGSGAVGLEAASRGAAPVLLVEGDRRTAQVTRRNADELGLTVEVRALRVETVLAQPATRSYDIVFADPPYELAADTLDRLLGLAWTHGWVAEHGLVVVERSRRTPPPSWPAAVTDTWSRTYGETIVYFGGTS
jgi:16S rRNA (guanine966-N2)-methyltransferase